MSLFTLCCLKKQCHSRSPQNDAGFTVFESVNNDPPNIYLYTEEVKRYPADIRVKFPKTYALVHQNITLECFALGK